MHHSHKTGKSCFAFHVSCFTFYTCYSTFVVLIFLTSALAQNETGKIEGQVIDRKKDLPLAQQQVLLKIHQGEEVQQRETLTDNNGSYVFDNLPIAFDVYCTISTTYEGKDYIEDDLVLSEWVSGLKVNIEIGAFTGDSSKVKVRQHTIVITPPPENHAPDQAVSVMEILQIENTSDLAFQTTLNGQPAGIHFNLPSGYEQLQFDQLFKQPLANNEQQLVSNQPLAPGQTSLGYSYVTHVGDSGLDLSRMVTFDTEQLYVFITEGMPLEPQSRILGAGRREQIHDMSYTIYATDPAKSLVEGQTADLRFKVSTVAPQSTRTGSPVNQQPSNPLMIALIAITAACAGAFLVAAVFKIRSPATETIESPTSQPAPDASWLRKLDAADLDRTRIARLEMVTRLEEMYEKKEISERVYNRLRKEQTDRLTAVLERIKQ